ncbi:hypothetical protein PQU92_13580 [Asticcacaulis sp. BYS171W]|uniref:DUF2029 domain-containing protein n=1 Tax=Asticcacaulis aquaticus TaxID=2984212 RepID=A0ABT5HW79_9CAUL|nr:hypothetical protein [Asticcacaulis aquaticus]MDC7684313.1 hypothetical protein [Asticcacaulis aquaticus]
MSFLSAAQRGLSLAGKLSPAEDAISWLKRVCGTTAARNGLILAFTLPLTAGVIGRIVKGRPWLVDFDAYACAAETVGRGQSPYSLTPVCEGLSPTPYVYAPQIARAFAPLLDLIGHDAARGLYLLGLCLALAYIGWVGMIKAFPKASPLLRIPVYGVLTGSSIASGNIGIILHGLILCGLFQLDRRRWPFIAAVIFGALFKPTLLTCLLVLLCQDRPWRSRLGVGLAAGVLGIAAYATLVLTAGAWGDDWKASLAQIVMTEQPGIGLLAWLSWTGLTPDAPLSMGLALIYMAGVALTGLLIAEFGRLNGEERLLFGLGIAQLVNPRLMDYDILYVAPCLVILLRLTRQTGRTGYRWLSWAFLALFTGILLINLLDGDAIPIIPLSVLSFTLLLTTTAGLMLWARRGRIRTGLSGQATSLPVATAAE